MIHRLLLVTIALVCYAFPCAAVVSSTKILDFNDEDALTTLKNMAITGDNHAKIFAEAWIVLSSVALGEGLAQCHLPQGDSAKYIWKPALDGLNSDEIYELNRLITSNFRHAENNGSVSIDHLYPITRQVVIYLGGKYGHWNCQRNKEVWFKSEEYMKQK